MTEGKYVEQDPDWRRFGDDDDFSFSVFLLTHHLPGQGSAWRTAPMN